MNDGKSFKMLALLGERQASDAKQGARKRLTRGTGSSSRGRWLAVMGVVVCVAFLPHCASANLATPPTAPVGSGAVSIDNPLRLQFKADEKLTDHACSEDAKRAGCYGKHVGHALLRCLHHYLNDHKDFVVTPDCKTDILKLREDLRKNEEAQAAHKAK